MKSVFSVSRRIYSSGFTERILLLGAPGVGKGSYASRASYELGVPHLSTGKMIREEISKGTELGLEYQKYTDAGEILPYYYVTPLICGKLGELSKENKGCFVDGFPRTIQGAEALVNTDGISIGGESSDIKVVYLHHLGQEDDIILEKVLNRRVCSECGKNYNTKHIIFKDGVHEMPELMPEVEGVCDRCGGVDTLVQRSDDVDPDVVKNRLAVFRENTLPVIDFFNGMGIMKEFVIDGGTKKLLPSFLELIDDF